ncbi:Uncharacterized protein SCF082_LOCUS42628 [Durusdinium trenchii]|uniref:Uncharacterized protein n=1 Tax=Durusdinium trenchii TaxID=1381693 RepID=A0ABP0QQ60_9DINO
MVFALDGSSWMSCKAEPQCLAERLAQEIFRFHVGTDSSFDPERSGAEWWAQVRDTGHEEEGIQFHWDTDEAAVERHGINVHPHLSTVTYLTDCGAPTLILDCRNTRTPCETSQVYGEISGGALSWPERWKHIAFDGQLLHGTVPGGQGGQGGRRITFLVNIWLNHRPSNCRRLSKALRRRVAADLASPVSVLSTTRPATWRSDGDGVRAASKRTFRFGRQRLLHEVSCKLPSAKAASTLQLCWSKGEAVIGSVLEDDLRQEKQDADNKIECLKEKARNLETELRDLQRKTEAQELAKLTAAAKAAQADEQLQQMETQVQELQREARVHVKLAEEQQVMISQQQLELAKLQQQLEEKQAAAKDPGDEERTRLLREGLAMAVEELDLRQANFCLEKQRLTGALEESRRLSMGYLGVTSASFDSAKVAGLEQQLASERQRSVQQAVSLQRLERQVMQQQMAKDQAEVWGSNHAIAWPGKIAWPGQFLRTGRDED